MKSLISILVTCCLALMRWAGEAAITVCICILGFGMVLAAIYLRTGLLGTFVIAFLGLLALAFMYWAIKRVTGLDV